MAKYLFEVKHDDVVTNEVVELALDEVFDRSELAMAYRDWVFANAGGRIERMRDDIPACPFCGATAAHYTISPGLHYIMCTECACQTARYASRDIAVYTWARRAT